MSCLAAMEKTPSDRLDFDIDYGRWLPDGDIVVDATAAIADPVTFVIDQVVWSEQVVRVWVSGGTVGEESEIAVYAVTQGGRTKEACFEMRIKEC